MSQRTLQIDLEEAGRAVAALRQSHEELAAELAAVTSAVEALLPTWDGSGKQQFAPAWEEWRRVMGEVLAAVPALAGGIQREADDIRAADGSSSFRA